MGPDPTDTFTANTERYDVQESSKVAALADGGFVVVWTNTSRYGLSQGADVRAQRFDADGTKIGPELLVNSEEGAWGRVQYETSVTAHLDGGFAIAWIERGSDKLWARNYDANGEPTGPEFQINRFGHTGGSNPDVAITDDGRLLATWFESGAPGDDDGTGIVIQAFDPDAGPRYVPTAQNLEYAAKIIAYVDIGEENPWNGLILPEGYVVGKSITAPGTVFNYSNHFQAIPLVSADGEPILAVRGTSRNLLDWLNNADPGGIGHSELQAVWSDIRDWLISNPGAHITGHSQGGAQAQLIAAWATAAGIPVGQVHTYNSPGIARVEADRFNPDLAGAVWHHIASGDVVSMAGERFITGDVYHYDFQAMTGDMLDSSHTGALKHFMENVHVMHWANMNMAAHGYTDYGIGAGRRHLTEIQTSEQLSQSDFSYLAAERFDTEYFSFLLGMRLALREQIEQRNSIILNYGERFLNDQIDLLTEALSQRGTTEALRQGTGEFGHLLLDNDLLLLLVATRLGEDGRATLFQARETVSGWDSSRLATVSQWDSKAWSGFAQLGPDFWAGPARIMEAAQLDAMSLWPPSAFQHLAALPARIVADLLVDTTVDAVTAMGHWTYDMFLAAGRYGHAAAQRGLERASEIAEAYGNAVLDMAARTAQFIQRVRDHDIEVVEQPQTGAGSTLTIPALYIGAEGGSVMGAGPDSLYLPASGTDRILLQGGNNTIFGTPQTLNLDRIEGFRSGDQILLLDTRIAADRLFVTRGSAVLDIDTDGDGIPDMQVRLEGDYHLDGFVVTPQGDHTLITYEPGERTAGTGPDLLIGTDGTDVIDGLAGNDTLYGSGGDDTLYGGDGDDRLFGGDGDDHLFGGAGADRLDGGTGANTLNGGLGNDRYVIRSVHDVIEGEIGYSQGGGIDTVEAWIDYTLTSNLEILRLQGTEDLRGYGGWAPEALVGNAGNNWLDGGHGNDVLNGKDGDDTLIGGMGADSLVGEAGADVFLFRSVAESRPGQESRDFINGFFREEGDRIDLSQIDANTTRAGDQAFTFIGSRGFSGQAGELRYFTWGGNNFNIVEADVDGDGRADFQIFVNLTDHMVQSDFIL